jgi:hypothetical protein
LLSFFWFCCLKLQLLFVSEYAVLAVCVGVSAILYFFFFFFFLFDSHFSRRLQSCIMLDFIDISIVFLILVLIGYAWYTVKLVLQERKEEEVLWVETKNMHYIPFTLRQLQSALLGVNNTKVGPQVVQWKEFLLKTELVFGARYHLLKASLLEDYEPFDPNREGPSELPDPKLAILEDRFLSNFRHTMEKANFDMLTDEEAATASASNFLNTVPIVPEWLKMDPLFERYMEKHPELSKATYGGEFLWQILVCLFVCFFTFFKKERNVYGFSIVVLVLRQLRVFCLCKSLILCFFMLSVVVVARRRIKVPRQSKLSKKRLRASLCQ